MAIHGKAKSSSFTPAPEGLHRSVCCDAVDLGMLDGKYGRKHMFRYVWQTEELMENGKPYIVRRDYTLSMHKKSSLRLDVESWRGKPFASDEEAEAFDLESPIGANCQINVIHNKNGDQVYANIKAVVPAVRGMAPLKVRDYIRMINRPDYVPPEPEPAEEEELTEPGSFEAEEETPF